MNIFVGCGGHDGNDPNFLKIAYNIGKYIAKNNHTLVFGAYNEGLMGACYKGVIENTSNPKVKSYTLNKWKNNLEGLISIEEKLSEKMQERKQFLFDNSDITIILPGGIGTLDELFSQFCAKQIYETDNKIIVYNYNHYYDDIINMIKKLTKEGFLYNMSEDELIICDSEEDVYSNIEKNEK